MDHHADDQSHYEISLTAGQAFVAFVLLLLSLAASFAFGLMIGKGQADDRLVVRKEGPVVTEASLAPAKKQEGRIVELGVENDDFEQKEPVPPSTDTATTAAIVEEGTPDAGAAPATIDSAAAAGAAAEPPAASAHPASSHPAKLSATHYAQLLSTGDQRVAEALAARLINGGFTSAYVERGSNEKGPIYRVRVRFDSEEEARTAEPKLKAYSKDVWITAK